MNQKLTFFKKDAKIISISVTPESKLDINYIAPVERTTNFFGVEKQPAIKGYYYWNGRNFYTIEELFKYLKKSTSSIDSYFKTDGEIFIKPCVSIVLDEEAILNRGRVLKTQVVHYFETFEQALSVGESIAKEVGMVCIPKYK